MSDVTDKIKKLLRLAQSSNQHEAELALQRAFEMAARHNIDMAGLDLDDTTKRILHEKFHVGERFSLIRKLTFGILETFFNVSIVMARPNILFVGTATDVQIAIYIHQFLVGVCSRALRAFETTQRRKLTPTKRNGFIAGFMYGVSAKLRGAKKLLEIDENRTGLVLAEEARRDNYVEQNFKTHEVSLDCGRKHRNALLEGWESGNAVEFNKPLENATPKPLLLGL